MSFQNVGGADRTFRLWLGILLLAADAFLVPSGRYEAIIAFAGVMVIASALLGFCVLYLPFGFSTAREVRPAACCGTATPGGGALSGTPRPSSAR